MSSQVFIGRSSELELLESQYCKQMPSLVVIKGRRRVGKSRLTSFFAAKHGQARLWDFSGLAPRDGMDDQSQRDNFSRQLALILNLPPFSFQDWSDAFECLSSYFKAGDIILFDEISWMGAKDTSFIPKLKTWWDKQTIAVMLFFCGSVSTWIEENILNSTAFFGRINLTISLEPLPIPDAYKLLKAYSFKGSDYEAFKLLSVLGGIPWYIQQINPGQSADDIIKQLCFVKGGMLVLEFERIFHDLFDGKGATYKKILEALKEGMKTLADVRANINFSHSGTLSALMEHLVIAGFVKKQKLWSFKTEKALKQSLYYICDPYMRFYLKLIEPQKNKIDLDGFKEINISHIAGFDAHIGLQMEQLLLQNRSLLLKSIGVNPCDVVADGPYRQSKTSTRSGCQVDYLIQTATNNIFICEFKFKRRELGVDVMTQVQHKVSALKIPRGFAAIPVLFHVGGVSANLATSEYFYRIVDIADFLHI